VEQRWRGPKPLMFDAFIGGLVVGGAILLVYVTGLVMAAIVRDFGVEIARLVAAIVRDTVYPFRVFFGRHELTEVRFVFLSTLPFLIDRRAMP